MLNYTLSCPPLGASDVVERTIKTKVNDIDQADEVVPASATEFARSFADNDAVEIFFVDKDDAGNFSPPGVSLTFTATDTIPPSAPGAPAVLTVTET